MTFKLKPLFFPSMHIAVFLLWKHEFLMSNIRWLKRSYSFMLKKKNIFLYVLINTRKILIALHFHLSTMSYHSQLQQKILDSILHMTWELPRMCWTYAAKFTLACDPLAPFVTIYLPMQQKTCLVPLCFQNKIIVILFSMVAQCICWKDIRRFKAQQQD